MIKSVKYLITIGLALLLLISWRNNPPDGRTGAPVDSTCATPSCHTSNSTDINGVLEIRGLPERLTAGESYNLTVRLDATEGAPQIGGFQMTALIGGNTGVGTFSNPGSNVGISSIQTRQYVDHRNAIEFTNNRVEYKVQWTAPSPLPSDELTFYANSVFANGNGQRSGDRIRSTSISFEAVSVIDNDMDGFDSDEDCNDSDPNINPSASEIPNNQIDENCDGVIETIDIDEDGFNSDEDCNDSDPNINPSASEIPNNQIDENCDGIIETIDIDEDGFNSDEDCNDSDPNINPSASEIPNNEVDENCDGFAEIIDVDMDGFNSDEDCDDSNVLVNPDAMEIIDDNIDNNCNGEVDECVCTTVFDPVCGSDGMTYSNTCVAQCAGITEVTSGACIEDKDMDGFDSDDDCDDNNAEINPDAQEIVGNDIDENCDGMIEKDSTIAVLGKIEIKNGNGLRNVRVTLSDGTEAITDINGSFLLEDVTLNGNLTLTFSRNDNATNGVSALDVVQIVNHILGKSSFADELQILAADADGNGSVSSLDLVHIINVLIGRWDTFMNRESWGFVPQTVGIQDLSSGQSLQISAYKVGDVNSSANPN